MLEMYAQKAMKSRISIAATTFVGTIVSSSKSRWLLEQPPGRNHNPTFPPECDVALAILADTSPQGKMSDELPKMRLRVVSEMRQGRKRVSAVAM